VLRRVKNGLTAIGILLDQGITDGAEPPGRRKGKENEADTLSRSVDRMGRISQALSGRSLWITVGVVLLIVVGGTGYWLGKSEDRVNDKGLVLVAEAEAEDVHPHAGKQKNPA